MRFLVDECTGPTVAKWLRGKSHEVFSVYDEAGFCLGWLDPRGGCLFPSEAFSLVNSSSLCYVAARVCTEVRTEGGKRCVS